MKKCLTRKKTTYNKVFNKKYDYDLYFLFKIIKY